MSTGGLSPSRALSQANLGNSFRAHNTIDDAFEQAKSFFEKTLGDDQNHLQWLQDTTSAQNAIDAALAARSNYLHLKGQQYQWPNWLRKLPDLILCYSSVLDTAVQSNPEYSALIWGALKFLLMGASNHAKTFKKIGQAFADIGHRLTRINEYVKWYPKQKILPTLVSLYEDLLDFVKQATEWFKAGRLKRFTKSFTEPFEIGLGNVINDIETKTHYLDMIASTEHMGNTYEIKQLQKETISKVNDYSSMLTLLLQIVRGMETGQQDISRVVQAMHTSDILKEFDDLLNGALVRLDSCRAVARSRGSWRHSEEELRIILHKVRTWARHDGPSMLVVQTIPQAQAQLCDLAVDLIDFSKAANATTLWALSDRATDAPPTSNSSFMWRMLVAQAMRASATIFGDADVQAMAPRFREAQTDDQWIALLSTLLPKLRSCIIIVEAKSSFEHVKYDTRWVVDFLDAFRKILDSIPQDCRVKIMVASFCTGTTVLTSLRRYDNVHSTFITPATMNARKRRKVARRTEIFAGGVMAKAYADAL